MGEDVRADEVLGCLMLMSVWICVRVTVCLPVVSQCPHCHNTARVSAMKMDEPSEYTHRETVREEVKEEREERQGQLEGRERESKGDFD